MWGSAIFGAAPRKRQTKRRFENFLNWHRKRFGKRKKNVPDDIVHREKSLQHETFSMLHHLSHFKWNRELCRKWKRLHSRTERENERKREREKKWRIMAFPLLQFPTFHWWKIEIAIRQHTNKFRLRVFEHDVPNRGRERESEKENRFGFCLLKGRVENGIMECDFLVIFYVWTCHASFFFLGKLLRVPHLKISDKTKRSCPLIRVDSCGFTNCKRIKLACSRHCSLMHIGNNGDLMWFAWFWLASSMPMQIMPTVYLFHSFAFWGDTNDGQFVIRCMFLDVVNLVQSRCEMWKTSKKKKRLFTVFMGRCVANRLTLH